MLNFLSSHLVRLIADKRGVTAIEYAMIGSIFIVGIVASVLSVGNHLPSIFNQVSSEL